MLRAWVAGAGAFGVILVAPHDSVFDGGEGIPAALGEFVGGPGAFLAGQGHFQFGRDRVDGRGNGIGAAGAVVARETGGRDGVIPIGSARRALRRGLGGDRDAALGDVGPADPDFGAVIGLHPDLVRVLTDHGCAGGDSVGLDGHALAGAVAADDRGRSGAHGCGQWP